MVHLQDNPFSTEPNSPSSKPLSYKHRRFWKYAVRVTLISSLLFICYLIGRGVQWQSIKESYGFNTKDVDFIRYFCSSESQSSLQKDLAPLESDELEHQKALHLNQQNSSPLDENIPSSVWDNLPVKGAYYMIVRNEKLGEARSVIKSMENHMINGTQYPMVILNNQYFTEDFKKYVRKVATAPVFFGKIDAEAWEYPHWINVPLAEQLIKNQETNNVYRGGSLSYHQLLRYQAGFFFHHPLLRDVQYAWRLEPGADYSCQMDEDMFLLMKEQNKKLGFVLTMRESSLTIPTLWTRVKEFKELHPEYIRPPNETIYPWIVYGGTDEYNLCHFWTNFQIADLSFFRSKEYQKYFEYLDHTGNFFYERWSDAPVQTIAAALFLKREDIHFFNNIGYTHSIATHCPYNESLLRKCSCDVTINYDLYRDSCTRNLLRLISYETLIEMKTFLTKTNIKVPYTLQ